MLSPQSLGCGGVLDNGASCPISIYVLQASILSALAGSYISFFPKAGIKLHSCVFFMSYSVIGEF